MTNAIKEDAKFLDEISSMSPDMQAKVLRALEERTFRRVGSTTSIHVDVQILAASNKKLAELIEKGEFREDLYYRLNVFPIEGYHLQCVRTVHQVHTTGLYSWLQFTGQKQAPEAICESPGIVSSPQFYMLYQGPEPP